MKKVYGITSTNIVLSSLYTPTSKSITQLHSRSQIRIRARERGTEWNHWFYSSEIRRCNQGRGDPVNKEVKCWLILLFAIFLLVNLVIVLLFGGCPAAYDVEKIEYDPDIPPTRPPSNVHVTDQELASRPYLREAFEQGKSILLPIGAITDFIPGNWYGQSYATHRMPIWERDYFEKTITIDRNTIWEHNGTYIRFLVRTC
jgi:hypothetical protein